MVDFVLGGIVGITIYALVQEHKKNVAKKTAPKRGRPPKKVEVKDSDAS